jgi:hypothetical protein
MNGFMHRKKTQNPKPATMTDHPGKETDQDQVANESYVKRLAIQRKILKKFVEPEPGLPGPSKSE